MSRILFGVLWIVTMLLALFSTISFSSNIYKLVTLILFVISFLLTLRNKYWIAYIWFAGVSGLCLIYWFARGWMF